MKCSIIKKKRRMIFFVSSLTSFFFLIENLGFFSTILQYNVIKKLKSSNSYIAYKKFIPKTF